MENELMNTVEETAEDTVMAERERLEGEQKK